MKKAFKRLFLTTALTLSPAFILGSCGPQEGDKPIIEEPTDKTFTLTSQFDATKGSVTLSKTEGKVGEKITATITPNEGFKCTSIKFNEETREVAASIEITPVEGQNKLVVTFEAEEPVTPPEVIDKELVPSGNYKTEYLVGEQLTFEGLEVKLFTTTNGVKDEGVVFTDYSTNVEEGYTFTESDITAEGDTYRVVIYAEDETITSAIIDLTISPAPVEEVDITPADFLAKMKKVGKYKIENNETSGIHIPNANYWTAKASDYDTYGFAENGERIIIYQLVGDRVNEIASYKQVDETKGYSGMYDDAFSNYLVDTQQVYFNRGIEFISDKEIETYRSKLKPSVKNPNEYIFGISDDPSSVFARDIIQLTYNGTLALNDSGLSVTMGPGTKISLEIIDQNTMKIKVLNGTTWPIETTITIDETLDIPEIQPFLKNETLPDPDLDRAKAAFDTLRKGNFTTSTGDVFTSNYIYRKTDNYALYSNQANFTFDSKEFTAGSYKVQFSKENKATKDSLTPLENGDYPIINSNALLNKDAEYLPFYNEEDNTILLTLYVKEGSNDYFTNIPSLYSALFNINLNTTEKDVHFANIEFKVHFTDKECKIVDWIDVKFGRASGNETIKLTDFGTSKVSHVDTFISSIK